MKMLRYFLILLIFPMLSLQPPAAADMKPTKVKTGLEVLMSLDFKPLYGKRVGLITNPTGVTSELKSTIDVLFESEKVHLVALFGPEHGVRGEFAAGEKIESGIDVVTGIPIYSLYGTANKPNSEMLKEIDVLIYDIQDIGCRTYTYISTMGLAMDAAAEAGIEFMVLDRPNPLGGQKIEGPVAEKELFSLVGAFPIPYVYGLTSGELARMINKEGWLKSGKSCKLTVIKMKGWRRGMQFKDTGLPWVPSSPHVPLSETAYHYVSTGVLGELGVIHIGIGYTIPFGILGHKRLDAVKFAAELNEYYKGNVIFRPISYRPFYGGSANETLQGVQLYIKNPELVTLMSIQFKFMEIFRKNYPDIDLYDLSSKRHDMFDKVNGTREIREKFFANYRYEDIEPLIKRDEKSFQNFSSKYYLY